jgi:hypothetical protein
MKKIFVIALLLILSSTHIILAAEGDQLPESTMEGQTISSQLSSPSTDLNDTLLPAPSEHEVNDITKAQDDLSHEGLTSVPQNKGFLQLFNIFRLFKTNKATPPVQPTITKSELAALKEPRISSLPEIKYKDNKGEAIQAVPDELTHQVLSSDIQGNSTFSFIKQDDATKIQIPAPALSQGAGAVGLTSTSGQIDPDDISHQSLVTEVQGKDIMNIFFHGDSADNLTISNNQDSTKGTTTPDDAPKNSQTLSPQASGAEDLPHQSFITVIRVK